MKKDKRTGLSNEANETRIMLIKAVSKGNIPEVEKLLTQGAKVNAKVVSGDSILNYAVENNILRWSSFY